MSTTSVSFFPSSKLLSVDQYFVDQGRVLHSRDVDEIVDYVSKKSEFHRRRDLQACKEVKKSIVNSRYHLLSSM